ncbi:MAG: phospho-sugar mutase [Myxococcaceae bacterium]|nr:MAG: phospho-sugar mutase [Myxococcaceae bacterium]
MTDRSRLIQQVDAWSAADPDETTRAELQQLLAAEDFSELEDRFAGTLEFGTAGLRGVVGGGPNRMNRAVVRRASAGLAGYLLATVPDAARRGVVVARDGRRMSKEFAEDTAAVLAAAGIPALVRPGFTPTPLCAFLVEHLGASAGVMVTASHNPPEYNGYKVYWGNGAQIVPPHDGGIAAAIARVGPAREIPLADLTDARVHGLLRDIGPELDQAYLEGVLALRLHPGEGTDLTVVYTPMHGVGGPLALEALRRAGFGRVHPVPEQLHPDPAFPTVRFPNPEEPGAMDLSRALAERTRADLVLANDPDADRLAVLTRETSGLLRALTGNEVGVLLGHYLLVQGPRRERPLVMTTIVSSPQLGAIAQRLGALYDETLTGFKWIANRSLERAAKDGAGLVFGFEEALGYTVGTLVRDKDGIGAALAMADLAGWARARGTTVAGYLEEIQREFGVYVSKQRSFTLPGASGAETIARVMEAFRKDPPSRVGSRTVEWVKDYKARTRTAQGRTEPLTLPASNVIAYGLAGGARVTLRPSGTEPKIKYYFELPETLAAGEDVPTARTRGEERLAELERDFLTLATARGQPDG